MGSESEVGGEGGAPPAPRRTLKVRTTRTPPGAPSCGRAQPQVSALSPEPTVAQDATGSAIGAKDVAAVRALAAAAICASRAEQEERLSESLTTVMMAQVVARSRWAGWM